MSGSIPASIGSVKILKKCSFWELKMEHKNIYILLQYRQKIKKIKFFF